MRVPPLIINLKSKQKQVVNFTPLLIYPPKRDPQYHTHWRVGWLQSQVGDLEGEKNYLPLPGLKP